MPPILNLKDVMLTQVGHGVRFGRSTGQVGSVLGASQLGCRLVVLPPGKRGWPFHSHAHNEEVFVILSGAGTLRLGEAVHAVREGDVAVCPAGGAESAHQLIASDEGELRYLAISTLHQPEICLYPDSGKVLLTAAAPGREGELLLDHCARLGEDLDYWDGE